MLDTLLKIGKWQSQGKSQWDRFLDYPKVETEDKHGNKIKNYTLPILFDLDENEVVIDSENLREYDEDDVAQLKALKIKGGNNKAIYVTVPAKKIDQIYKTFFGREGEETLNGQLVEGIKKTDSNLLTKNFGGMLSDIFDLKVQFREGTTKENEKTGTSEINIKTIEEKLEFGKPEKLILLTVFLKSEKYGFKEPVVFAKIPEYNEFITRNYFGNQEEEEAKQTTISKKLCYASGDVKEEVEELALSTRYSLNKMFVTETRNYATQFNNKRFSNNYQVSKSNQEYLDYSSDFLLNGGYKTKIANIDHVIIPEFQSRTEVDWEMALNGIKKKSDLLFNFKTLENTAKDIQDETDAVFWINFVAFESDGNFFKSTEVIKDVSNFHFFKVLKAFTDIDWEMKEANFVNWNKVMTEYNEPRFFNLNTIYSLIPLRKDKEKKNKALDLFKAILENRTVEKDKLCDYFTELILCHWYERYGSYTNVQKSSKDYFGNAARESVFKYHAFFQVLKKLKLIDMEEISTNPIEESGNKYDQAIQQFFKKMSLNKDQQAMFYLGRLLNTVEYIQKDKNKTVIQKVNFNGMDRDDIERLRIALIEKAKQYSAVGKVIFTDKKFGDIFDFNNWKMSPQEAVFFLLTGFSFGVGGKEKEVQEPVESEDQTN